MTFVIRVHGISLYPSGTKLMPKTYSEIFILASCNVVLRFLKLANTKKYAYLDLCISPLSEKGKKMIVDFEPFLPPGERIKFI